MRKGENGQPPPIEVVVQFLSPGSQTPLVNDRFAASESQVTLPRSGDKETVDGAT